MHVVSILYYWMDSQLECVIDHCYMFVCTIINKKENEQTLVAQSKYKFIKEHASLLELHALCNLKQIFEL